MPEVDPLISKLLYAVAAGLAGLLVSLLLEFLVLRRHDRRPIEIGGYELQIRLLRGPLRLLLPAIFVVVALEWIEFEGSLHSTLAHMLQLWIIAALAWLAHRLIVMVGEMLREEFPVDVQDNLQARRVQTQFRVIERILSILITVIAIAAALMTFESVRQFGVSLLASAGVLGIVLGFAAQETLGTLMAGIQIAISQPIRLDDVVIVEGTYGRVQEITLTYVVIDTWNERNLIVPIKYFLDNPFENWTYTESRILGTVYLYTDYSVPVQDLRTELERVLENSEWWDGRVWNLQVSNSTDRALELRALMSAIDSSSAWNLRVHVRERLVQYLQEHYPDSLPKVRLEQEPVAEKWGEYQSQDGSS